MPAPRGRSRCCRSCRPSRCVPALPVVPALPRAAARAGAAAGPAGAGRRVVDAAAVHAVLRSTRRRARSCRSSRCCWSGRRRRCRTWSAPAQSRWHRCRCCTPGSPRRRSCSSRSGSRPTGRRSRCSRAARPGTGTGRSGRSARSNTGCRSRRSSSGRPSCSRTPCRRALPARARDADPPAPVVPPAPVMPLGTEPAQPASVRTTRGQRRAIEIRADFIHGRIPDQQEGDLYATYHLFRFCGHDQTGAAGHPGAPASRTAIVFARRRAGGGAERRRAGGRGPPVARPFPPELRPRVRRHATRLPDGGPPGSRQARARARRLLSRRRAWMRASRASGRSAACSPVASVSRRASGSGASARVLPSADLWPAIWIPGCFPVARHTPGTFGEAMFGTPR